MLHRNMKFSLLIRLSFVNEHQPTWGLMCCAATTLSQPNRSRRTIPGMPGACCRMMAKASKIERILSFRVRPMTTSKKPTFQETILRLQTYWNNQGCALLQPYDMEVGAGTSHTATFLRAIGPEPWKAAYVQPSRRPKDGRYGENPAPDPVGAPGKPMLHCNMKFSLLIRLSFVNEHQPTRGLMCCAATTLSQPNRSRRTIPVSYTHLTLPTSDLV